MPGRILMVDDDRPFAAMLAADLGRRGFAVTACARADEALEALRRAEHDAVLTDLRMPGTDGLALCARAAEVRPGIPVLVLTAFGSMEAAVGALRAGAFDFVQKPVDLELLALALERAVAHGALRERVRVLDEAVAATQRFEQLEGQSEPMRRLFEQLSLVAPSDASVLLVGESGTGKELAARALHQRSRRAAGPFVALSCAALPENLLEAELFGAARGAYTDAREARPGLLAQADGGTLFLDEVGDLPQPLQPKLLRTLEERAARPVGGGQEVRFDVRLVAATNLDLEEAAVEGRFRRDLLYRLDVIRVELPPLRSRGTDVLLLAGRFADHFARRAAKSVAGVSPEAGARLLDYPWPGNVRELRNVIERAVALTRTERVVPEDLPERVRDHRSSDLVLAGQDPAELVSLDEVERRYVLHVLAAAGGNKARAARILGLDRKTLYRKLERWGPGPGGTGAG